MTASSPTTAEPASALLQEAPLRELIAANIVAGVTAKGGNGGFVLEIRFGDRRALLASARGNARIFASLATIAVLLQRLGYPRFEVDVTEYVRGRVRAAQPLRSASMKRGRLPEASSGTSQRKNVQTGHVNAD
jgi:hypothetical protein